MTSNSSAAFFFAGTPQFLPNRKKTPKARKAAKLVALDESCHQGTLSCHFKSPRKQVFALTPVNQIEMEG